MILSQLHYTVYNIHTQVYSLFLSVHKVHRLINMHMHTSTDRSVDFYA